MEIRANLLSFFRGIMFFHSNSLEFRAKIYASMLLVKDEVIERDYRLINEFAKEIYPKQNLKISLLVAIVKEYIQKAKTYPNFSIDSVLKEIDRDMKSQKKYAKKINFSHLRRMISFENLKNSTAQERVYEFLIDQVKIYS